MDMFNPKSGRTSRYVVMGAMDNVHHAHRELVSSVSCGCCSEVAEMGDVAFPPSAPIQEKDDAKWAQIKTNVCDLLDAFIGS